MPYILCESKLWKDQAGWPRKADLWQQSMQSYILHLLKALQQESLLLALVVVFKIFFNVFVLNVASWAHVTCVNFFLSIFILCIIMNNKDFLDLIWLALDPQQTELSVPVPPQENKTKYFHTVVPYILCKSETVHLTDSENQS